MKRLIETLFYIFFKVTSSFETKVPEIRALMLLDYFLIVNAFSAFLILAVILNIQMASWVVLGMIGLILILYCITNYFTNKLFLDDEQWKIIVSNHQKKEGISTFGSGFILITVLLISASFLLLIGLNL